MCQGGISLDATRIRIDRAHGRASSHVTSDIGATELGRWHDSHFAWKIRATSLVNVGGDAAGCASAIAGTELSRRKNIRARRTAVCHISVPPWANCIASFTYS
jgi:hypothetical protein